MERNKFSKELIHSQLETDELCHMTPEEKKAYNAEYYKRNKEKFWGVKGDRPVGRQKYVAEGGSGVYRRGEGLNNYSEIYSHSTAPKVGTTHRPRTGNTYATDNEMDWQDGFLKDVDENDPRKKLQKEYYEYKKYANMNDRLVKEYTNKANDCMRLAKEYEKKRAGWKTQGNNLSADDSPYRKWNQKIQETLEKASEYERRAKEAEKTKQEQIDGMKRCLEGIKRHQAEIEAHNSHTYEHRPSNKPHGATVSDTEAFNSAYKKAEKKEKVKKAAKQAASDWKSGAKAVSQLASDGVSKGKSIASSILSKFRK